MKETFIDTNYFVRLITKDDDGQLQHVISLFKEIEDRKQIGLVSILVINELIWILQNYYEFKRKEFIPQIVRLISLENIKIIEISKSQLFKILENSLVKNLDFTDLYLLHIGKGRSISTFDKDILKLSSIAKK